MLFLGVLKEGGGVIAPIAPPWLCPWPCMHVWIYASSMLSVFLDLNWQRWAYIVFVEHSSIYFHCLHTFCYTVLLHMVSWYSVYTLSHHYPCFIPDLWKFTTRWRTAWMKVKSHVKVPNRNSLKWNTLIFLAAFRYLSLIKQKFLLL